MKLIKKIKKTGLLVLTIATGLLIQSGSSYSQIYKSVDENGKITFSDQAEPGADTVNVKEPNTSQAIEVPAVVVALPEELAANTYKSLRITHPGNDSVIANGLMAFTVSTSISPTLNDKHQLQLIVDGQNHSTSRDSFTINSIDRGEHVLQVAVIDANGNVLKTSPEVAIFAYRPSTVSSANNSSNRPIPVHPIVKPPVSIQPIPKSRPRANAR